MSRAGQVNDAPLSPTQSGSSCLQRVIPSVTGLLWSGVKPPLAQTHHSLSGTCECMLNTIRVRSLLVTLW